MQIWPVPGIATHLIFCATDAELRIVRVLHGARDIASIFSQGKEEQAE